ncbi:hypothetical protein PR048_029802 [Dryococelus australis]|uniref:Uncharacterized protein n=1 Tax=Dryococelus australis TaxID=614101 RepID=A0ABQ9G9T9_9NEOP|nr:hypothetical protein PR048_029802 [Dryococelus australis]
MKDRRIRILFCSFLYDFIKKKLKQIKNIKEWFCSLIREEVKIRTYQFAWLSKLLSVNIMYIFPVRGHSYIHNDLNLCLYGQYLQKIEYIEHLGQCFMVMTECRSNPEPFVVIMPSEIIEDWSKGLAKFFQEHQLPRRSYFAYRDHYNLKGKGCEEMVCNQQLLKASKPTLKSTQIQDVLSLVKFMKPENSQWLQNLLDGIGMDDENNEDDVFSEDEEMDD